MFLFLSEDFDEAYPGDCAFCRKLSPSSHWTSCGARAGINVLCLTGGCLVLQLVDSQETNISPILSQWIHLVSLSFGTIMPAPSSLRELQSTYFFIRECAPPCGKCEVRRYNRPVLSQVDLVRTSAVIGDFCLNFENLYVNYDMMISSCTLILEFKSGGYRMCPKALICSWKLSLNQSCCKILMYLRIIWGVGVGAQW